MSGDLLKRLAEAGTPLDLVMEVAETLAEAKAAERLLERRRERDRERKRDIPRNSEESEESAEFQRKGSLEVSPPAPPLPKPSKISPLNPPIDRFKTEWNSMAARHRLPQIEAITGNRLKQVRRRCAEHDPEAVSRAIAMVPNCPHWLGENGWLGNFDSLMRPDNFQRMIEGAYCSKIDPGPMSDDDQIALLRRMLLIYERDGRPDLVEQCNNRIAELERMAA